MIEIDGSQGEGGGQIIRSSLALSMVTGIPFRITNIRAGRKKSGLKRQHVTCVRAAREVCNGDFVGADLGSSELTFAPGPVVARDFEFKIGTAGSTTLVAQTVLPALMVADAPSTIAVEGGTHNRGAPPFDFLAQVYLPQVTKMGPDFDANIERHGFYPAGGGHFTLNIAPSEKLDGLCLDQREEKCRISARALLSRLPRHIAERELEVIRRKANLRPNECQVVEITDSPGPGNALLIEVDSGNVKEIITAFGERGITAEQVARSAYREAKPYLEGDVPVGEHLADQLLLPMGIAASTGATSSFISQTLSLHATTHIDILKMFLDISINVEALDEGQVRVVAEPRVHE